GCPALQDGPSDVSQVPCVLSCPALKRPRRSAWNGRGRLVELQAFFRLVVSRAFVGVYGALRVGPDRQVFVTPSLGLHYFGTDIGIVRLAHQAVQRGVRNVFGADA